MIENSKNKRTVGLMGAVGVGIGAIVGGGIFALAGTAFSVAGPSAIFAFLFNGLIAFLTVFSFAQMSKEFPESGGTYTFSKKVMSVQSAFAIGWIVWFASIIAAVLYAMGFASYALEGIKHLFPDNTQAWFFHPVIHNAFAIGAVLFYSFKIINKKQDSSHWAMTAKLAVFFILIFGGLWALAGKPLRSISVSLTPFFAGGSTGLFMAMGYTFITLQGFDLIAAIAGEVKDPEKNIPRAMTISLVTALAIYIPLLFIIATAGTGPGISIKTVSSLNPETVVAIAVQNYMGPAGFWFVIVAAVLAMLSALHANLLAASHIAFAMARDRTLPVKLSRLDKKNGTPSLALMLTSFTVIAFTIALPDLSSAGASASLIFLISFALVHLMNILMKKRMQKRTGLKSSKIVFYIPYVGLALCLALAFFQGIEVPSAGIVTLVWLSSGGIIFMIFFAKRARVVDASAEAREMHLVSMRGRNPLVLVPVANPDNTEAMIAVANTLTPPGGGKVVLLSVVSKKRNDSLMQNMSIDNLDNAQRILKQAIASSFNTGIYPETLITISNTPWKEILRVSRVHHCESLLLGLSDLKEKVMGNDLEKILIEVDSDVIILRAPKKWHIKDIKKILVPISRRNEHDVLRARLLTGLSRESNPEINFIRIVPEITDTKNFRKFHRELQQLAEDEVPGTAKTEIVRSDLVINELIKKSNESDLIVLGVQRLGPQKKFFGNLILKIARETQKAIIMISRKG